MNVSSGGSERSNLMSLRDRIGIDVGRRLRLEEALERAESMRCAGSTSSLTPAPVR